MSNILIIEDNEQLRKYLCEYLSAYDFTPYVLEDYEGLSLMMESVNPKLILLDITLPKFDGFYYLKQIRKHSQVPVIIISARSDEAEQIRGIEGGAYDYITKPFSINVLMAKINALLARENPVDRDLRVGSIVLSQKDMSLTNSEKTIELSKNEYKILALLLGSKGQYVSREKILEALWDDSSFVDDNTLTVNISRVKKKLSEIGFEGAILTKRGVGYAFTENS
jgi:DNA-binding response OmpR family regulator